MFSKIDVNGPDACELYQYLTSAQPGADGKTAIPWNFTKFLVDEQGNAVRRFEPQTTPEEIAAALAEE